MSARNLRTAVALANRGRRALERCLELLGPLPDRRVARSRGEGWDAGIQSALPSAVPEARAAWVEATRWWWRLSRHGTSDIVRAEARRWMGRHGVGERWRHEDLEAWARVGAYRAAQSWLPEGASSWRVWCGVGVRMELYKATRGTEHVHVPNLVRDAAARIRRELAVLELQGLPRDFGIAAGLAGLTREQADRIRTIDAIVHLDSVPKGFDEGDHHEVIPSPDEDLDERIDGSAELDRLEEAIAQLRPQWQLVVRGTMEGLTLKEIGESLRPPVSRERARQIEVAAVRELRRLLGAEQRESATVRYNPLRPRVERVLEDADEPLTTRQVAERLGAELPPVHAALKQVARLVGRRGKQQLWAAG